MKRVAVTGSDGLVGRHTVERLKGMGIETSLLDRTSGCDIRDRDAVTVKLSGCDTLVHAAALISDDEGTPDEIFSINVNGTWNVLDAARRNGVANVVLLSSVQASGLYGDDKSPCRFPIDEQDISVARAPYGLSKLLVERTAEAFTEATGITTTCLRPLWVMDDALVEAASHDQSLLGSTWKGRLWVHVEDLVEAIFLSLSRDTGHLVLFVGADDVSGTDSTAWIIDQFFPLASFEAASDEFQSLVDCSLAKRRLGWEPLRRWPRRP